MHPNSDTDPNPNPNPIPTALSTSQLPRIAHPDHHVRVGVGGKQIAVSDGGGTWPARADADRTQFQLALSDRRSQSTAGGYRTATCFDTSTNHQHDRAQSPST